jgi:acyl dehydratase
MTPLETTAGPITRTQIVRFAGAAGDFNPMHHDEPFALAAGQPSVFAMGQLSAAIVAKAVADWLGRDNVVAYGVRFTDKVWPGDSLVIRADEPAADNGVRSCELTVEREHDRTVVMTGWVRARR